MSYSFFYNKTIKNYSYALMNVFKDIQCIKYDASGNVVETLSVPISYGQAAKYVQQALQPQQYYGNDNQEYGTRYYPKYPRMALNFEGISYNSSRQTDSHGVREFTATSVELSGTSISQVLVNSTPTPYDFNYTLYIKCDSMEYLSQLLEQILVFFNPKVNIRLKEFVNYDNIERDIPVSITSVSPVITTDLDESSRREISVDIGLTLEGFLYKPVSTSSIIKTISTQFFIIDSVSASQASIDVSGCLISSAGVLQPPVPTSYLLSGFGSVSGGTSGVNYDWFLNMS